MEDAARHPDDVPDAFEAAFARLRIVIETACAGEPDWPAGVAAGIRAALELVASQPADARILTTEALADGRPGFARYDRVITYLRDLLIPGRAERPDADRLPKETERALAGGIAMLVAQRLDTGDHTELPSLATEATQFVLTPYLGIAVAKRIAPTANN
jgi:hypothetical protein